MKPSTFPLTCFALFSAAVITAAIEAGILPTLAEQPPAGFESYYSAEVSSVHDGDSITCRTNMGRKLWIVDDKIRLRGINAPELSEDGGPESRNFLRELLTGKMIVLMTDRDKTGKYGRLLAVVWLWDGEWVDVNQRLVTSGHAVVKEY